MFVYMIFQVNPLNCMKIAVITPAETNICLMSSCRRLGVVGNLPLLPEFLWELPKHFMSKQMSLRFDLLGELRVAKRANDRFAPLVKVLR